MKVSSCGKQEGVIPRYILIIFFSFFFFFFKINTVAPSVHNVCRFVSSVSHFFIQLGRLQNSQFFLKIVLVQHNARKLEYAKIRTVCSLINGAEIRGENREIQLIIYYTRTAIQHEGQDEKVCQLTFVCANLHAHVFLTAHSSLNTNQRALG